MPTAITDLVPRSRFKFFRNIGQGIWPIRLRNTFAIYGHTEHNSKLSLSVLLAALRQEFPVGHRPEFGRQLPKCSITDRCHSKVKGLPRGRRQHEKFPIRS
jgi:hypothetical protein